MKILSKTLALTFVFLSLFFLTVEAQTSNFKKTTSIEGVRAISSKQFKNTFLRLGGDVGTQKYIGSHEQVLIQKTNDGYYSIKSTVKKNIYVRLDGSKINKNSKKPGGNVGVQSYVGEYEKFKIKQYSDGSVSFESKAFPGRYLRMGNDGSVNVQNRDGAHERFFLFKKK